jgi:hypothetical protein
MFMKSRTAVFAFVGCILAAHPARAANEIQTGLWQDTESSDVNGKPSPPKVSTDCVTPDQALDPVMMIKTEMQKEAQQCSKLDVRANGNVTLFEMKCGDPKQGSIEMTMTYSVHSPQHTSSVGKSTMTIMGQKTVSTINTDSKWIAVACKK